MRQFLLVGGQFLKFAFLIKALCRDLIFMPHFYTQIEFLWRKFNAALAILWREFGGLWRKYADFRRNQEPWYIYTKRNLSWVHGTPQLITISYIYRQRGIVISAWHTSTDQYFIHIQTKRMIPIYLTSLSSVPSTPPLLCSEMAFTCSVCYRSK